NVIWVKDDYLEKGLHPDLLRYYLASYTAHNKEVNFAWKIFADKVNTELVGAFGNFINRALTFTVKNFEGKVPQGGIDPEVMARIKQTLDEVVTDLGEYEFKKAIDSVMTLADYGNIYFQSHEPWKLVKSDKAAAGVVLRSCLQIAKAMVVLMQPVMPTKMEAAWKQLGLDGSVAEKSFQEALIPLPEGGLLGTPEILFSRMEEAFVKELDRIFKERVEKADIKGKAAEKAAAKKGEISFEEFGSLDLRIGEIKEAGPIKGSKKLLKLLVDIGDETRQVVAGIAGAYSAEELVGTQVVVLTNLKPTKLFGVESQAMLLAADAVGKAVLLRPREFVETGTKVR
ncbi:MAG: methionine--tRNA ligase subunit beta, partial [Methanothrix sp.]